MPQVGLLDLLRGKLVVGEPDVEQQGAKLDNLDVPFVLPDIQGAILRVAALTDGLIKRVIIDPVVANICVGCGGLHYLLRKDLP